MTNQAIIEKAIKLAIDGGWHPGWIDKRPVVKWGADYSTEYDEGEGVMVKGYHAKSNPSMWFFSINDLIFNQDFAKALWGEGLIQVINMEPAWRYHLQQMVIADDPIQYLGANL